MEIIGFIILVGIAGIIWKLAFKKSDKPKLPKDRSGGSGGTPPKNEQ